MFGPSDLAFTADGVPWAPAYGDVYHPAAGAWAQARHVFLAGNGLPGRWAGQERFVVLETGFGLGNNFLATWAAWRADPARCQRLDFVSVEKHPLSREQLAQALAASALMHPDEAAVRQPLVDALVEAWPLTTPDVHVLPFEDGRVRLLLGLGDGLAVLRQLDLCADAVYLDGFAPARNPALWSPEVLRQLARLSRPGTTAATWSAARTVREGLAAVGFRVERRPGIGGKRDTLTGLYAPVHAPARPAAQARAPLGVAAGTATVRREALVVGAGLAGTAAAWALAREGWRATVLDRAPTPAGETSGNPGGLMHGIFNAPDSLHARWFRAAALHTHRWARTALTSGAVRGDLGGFLRLETRRSPDEACEQLRRVGLPDAWVDWIHADRVHDRLGATPTEAALRGAWWFPTGGWLSPADTCRWWLDEAARIAGSRFVGNVTVARLRPREGAEGIGWQALDANGQVVGEAPVVVLACALDTPSLLAGLSDLAPGVPLTAVRGQTSVLPAAWVDGLRVQSPRRALSGQGYALALPDHRLLCGATSQHDDAGPTVRVPDHVHNLRRAAQLGLLDPALAEDPALLGALEGRVGWRAVTRDRLPVVGPPVDQTAEAAARAAGRRLDRPQHRPRRHGVLPVADGGVQRHGLYVLTGLGSRGLTSASLAAELLTSWITGAPCPVSVDLRDALDPARG